MTGDSIATSEFWQISGPADKGTLVHLPDRSPSVADRGQRARAVQGSRVRLRRLHPVQLRRRSGDRRGHQAGELRRSEGDRQGSRGRPVGRDRDGPGSVRQQGRHPRSALRHQHLERRQVRRRSPNRPIIRRLERRLGSFSAAALSINQRATGARRSLDKDIRAWHRFPFSFPFSWFSRVSNRYSDCLDRHCTSRIGPQVVVRVFPPFDRGVIWST